MRKNAASPAPARGKDKKQGRVLVAALAALVILGTSCALIRPAVTISRGCEKKEHTHTDSCYEQVTVAKHVAAHCTAGEATVLHQHDTSCYDEAGNLWCPLAELSEHQHTGTCYEVTNHLHNPSCYETQRGALLCKVPEEEAEHTHVATCFDAEGNSICGMEGTSGHGHDDGCYQMTEVCICGHNEGETRVLSCTLPEASAHTHTAAGGCYDEAGALVCEKPELARHTHTQDCFTVAEEPVDTQSCTCGLEEDESHTHSARCYGTWRLVCGLEEHQHGEACAPDYLCGLDEHTHTDACLDEEGVQVCGKQAHTHGEDCLPAIEPAYVCGLAEHTHGETCVDEEGNLVCELSEHTHGDECLAAKAPEYVCGLEEHTHDETCADEEGNLICGLTAHTHGAECLKVAYICGLEEHTHVGTCFDAEGALICGLAEHTHTESCVKPPEEIVCGKAEHLHEEGTCFDEAGNLICALEDHLHTAACVVLSEAARAKVEAVIAAIEGLKSAEELTVYFAGLEDAGDEDALVLAMLEEQEAFGAVCEQYYELSEGQKLCVTNKEKLEQLSELWNGTATLADPKYMAQTVNSDIRLNLFDYGSYINTRNDNGTRLLPKSFYFYHLDGPDPDNTTGATVSALDGFYLTADSKLTDKKYIHDYGINEEAGKYFPGTVPSIKKTLGTDGYPVLTEDNTDYSLSVLFQTENASTYWGHGNPNTSWGMGNGTYYTSQATLRANTKYIENETAKDEYGNVYTYSGYQTGYASKYFPVDGNGDGKNDDGGLFWKDADGYYVYDSAQKSAYFDDSTKRFSVSDMLIAPGHVLGKYQSETIPNKYHNGNFLPFNKIGTNFTTRKLTWEGGEHTTAYTPYTGTANQSEVANLGFGMSMEIDFYMPANGKVNGKDMVFEFKGDDDVWVFIDDVLVLNIGGTHGAEYGAINFATGAVTNPNGKTTGAYLRDCFTNAGKNVTSFNGNTFSDWSNHTLKFFYLERGGNISYCSLKFNLQTLPPESLTVRKELTADGTDVDKATVAHLKDTVSYQYRVLTADGKSALIGEGESYTLYASDTDTTGTTKTVGKGGIFELKSGQRAVFEDMSQYFAVGTSGDACKYIVQEIMPSGLTGQYGSVSYAISGAGGSQKVDGIAAQTGFTGYNSGVCSALQSTTVNYTNCVATEKLAALNITKATAGTVSAGDANAAYTFCVELGGVKLPAGTKYTVGTSEKTVTAEGQIQLKAGETAQIRLLAGTAYKVKEVIPTGAEYTATYRPENGTKDAAEGSVTTPGETVTVTVTNTYSMGALTLTKLVNNTADPSNTSGSFTFQLTTTSDLGTTSFPYTITSVGADGKETVSEPKTLTFTKTAVAGEEGKFTYTATLTLQHNQTATVSDLPAEVSFTVTETTTDGYSVSWTKSVEGDTDGTKTKTGTGANAPAVTIALGETICLTCTNTRGVELPQTGGAGTFRFTAGGLLLILAAVWLFGRYNFPRRARNKQN